MPNTIDSIVLGVVAFSLTGLGVALIREPVGTRRFMREVVAGVTGDDTLSTVFWFSLLLLAIVVIP